MDCLCMSSFMRSMAPSASVLRASCTCTCSTMWLPPLRSSPSRMLWLKLSTRASFDFGKPIMPKMQTRIVTTITTVLPVTFFRMRIVPCFCKLLSYCLFLTVARHLVGNRAAGHLQLDIVGLHAQDHRVVIANGDNRTDNSATGKDGVSILQGTQHRLLFLLLPLHGKEQQKIENAENQENGEKAQDRATWGRCLEN